MEATERKRDNQAGTERRGIEALGQRRPYPNAVSLLLLAHSIFSAPNYEPNQEHQRVLIGSARKMPVDVDDQVAFYVLGLPYLLTPSLGSPQSVLALPIDPDCSCHETPATARIPARRTNGDNRVVSWINRHAGSVYLSGSDTK